MRDRIRVIWDFDGTLLPSTPHDSEQTLVLAWCRADIRRQRAVKRPAARLLAQADRREWFHTDLRRRLYLKVYLWLLRGASAAFLDRVARGLAARIPPADREALTRLKHLGHPMAVVSCGTLDLSERTLRLAGIDTCFEWVAGNRLRFDAGLVSGMDVGLLNARSKVRCVQANGIDLGACAAVGDGYTDLPLLDGAGIAVMMDPSGEKRSRFRARGYHFCRSVAEAADIISKGKGLR